jgi:hypothetical protein
MPEPCHAASFLEQQVCAMLAYKFSMRILTRLCWLYELQLLFELFESENKVVVFRVLWHFCPGLEDLPKFHDLSITVASEGNVRSNLGHNKIKKTTSFQDAL